MPSSALHRFSIFLAVCTLCLVASVALGKGVVLATGVALGKGGIFPESDRLMGSLVAVLSIVQAGWSLKADSRSAVKLLAMLLAVGALATLAVSGLWQAEAVQILFGLAVAVSVVTSPAWLRGPRPVEDEGFPSMRTFGWLTPLCVLTQVALGAGLRYNALPVWPHVTGSLVFGAILMFAGMAALQSYGMHDSLRRAATALLWLTGLQLALGMGAYGVRMAKEPAAWTVHLTVAHVVTGAMMMGAATAFALQVFYHVRESLLVREAAI